MSTENQSNVDLTDSFIGQFFKKNEITKSLSHNLPEHQTDSVARCYLWLFTLYINIKIGKNSC